MWLPVLELSYVISSIRVVFDALSVFCVVLKVTEVGSIVCELNEESFTFFLVEEVVAFIYIAVLPNHSADAIGLTLLIVADSVGAISPEDETSSIRLVGFRVNLNKLSSLRKLEFLHGNSLRIL